MGFRAAASIVSIATPLVVAMLAASAPAVVADTVQARFPREPRSPSDTFMRMFPDLAPMATPTDALRQALVQLGAKGGPLDAGDDLSDAIGSIVDPGTFSPRNADNPTMTAGMTFFGQFIDHDLTFDRRSALADPADPSRTVNFRSAAFDLDSVYGRGPARSPELYDTASGDYKLKVERIDGAEDVSRGRAARYDLPRAQDGSAIVGDSRNDENILISQLHVAFLRLHNATVDRLRQQAAGRRDGEASPQRLFQRARRLVQWHYQWCVMHEFLPQTIGADRVAQILREGNRYYRPRAASRAPDRDGDRDEGRSTEPQIPIEFSVAAYRFGHSQIRPSYRLNFGPDGGTPFFAFVFDDLGDPSAADPSDLRGGRRAPRRFVDWQTFFDFGDGNVRPNKLIDTRLSSVLFEMPGARGPSPGLPNDGVQSLASRNLLRHVNFELPSGQAVAVRMGLSPLTRAQLAELEPYGLSASTPLWYYILKEAEVLEGGRRLGPVGARIVGEVFIGLMKADPDSYLSRNPRWRPTMPAANGSYRMADMLQASGAVTPLQ